MVSSGQSKLHTANARGDPLAVDENFSRRGVELHHQRTPSLTWVDLSSPRHWLKRPRVPTADVTVVVPCYNEAKRLQPAVFEPFMAMSARFRLLFVDDGSKDETRRVLKDLCALLGDRAAVLGLDVNGGKAEAVRAGLKKALHDGAKVVGYYDADGATPALEMLGLLQALETSQAKVVLASRVALLGRDIRRRPVRHYAGRVFATAASLILKLPVYDTQCGAKLFARSPALDASLEQPFTARWAFDVELIGRLLKGDATRPGLGADDFVEVPLGSWVDVAGSKLSMTTYPKVLGELAGIAWRLR